MLLVQDLLPGTVYQFRLSAVNINGTGPYTDWVSIETLHNDLDEKSEPDMPSPLKVKRVNFSKIKINREKSDIFQKVKYL